MVTNNGDINSCFFLQMFNKGTINFKMETTSNGHTKILLCIFVCDAMEDSPLGDE